MTRVENNEGQPVPASASGKMHRAIAQRRIALKMERLRNLELAALEMMREMLQPPFSGTPPLKAQWPDGWRPPLADNQRQDKTPPDGNPD
ncbi:MAG: hypothetical protein QM682_00895 [Paracoccus sp. (in: a-proteobacteria)]|uniref:hypothetical protein n=1 Tax=Paracoccus sp. TaxID=267 RepID=UPI0039E6A7CA